MDKPLPLPPLRCSNDVDFISQEPWSEESPTLYIKFSDRVQCYNAEKLLEWIEKTPVFALWIGKKMDSEGHGGKPSKKSLDQYWKLYEQEFLARDPLFLSLLRIANKDRILYYDTEPLGIKRIGNAEGSMGISELHGQSPGFNVYKLSRPSFLNSKLEAQSGNQILLIYKLALENTPPVYIRELCRYSDEIIEASCLDEEFWKKYSKKYLGKEYNRHESRKALDILGKLWEKDQYLTVDGLSYLVKNTKRNDIFDYIDVSWETYQTTPFISPIDLYSAGGNEREQEKAIKELYKTNYEYDSDIEAYSEGEAIWESSKEYKELLKNLFNAIFINTTYISKKGLINIPYNVDIYADIYPKFSESFTEIDEHITPYAKILGFMYLL